MQGFRERETFAEIQKNADPRPLSGVIFDMETPVSDLEAWGPLIEAVGTCPNLINPAAIHVVGKSISLLAEDIRRDWERCHDIATGGPR